MEELSGLRLPVSRLMMTLLVRLWVLKQQLSNGKGELHEDGTLPLVTQLIRGISSVEFMAWPVATRIRSIGRVLSHRDGYLSLRENRRNHRAVLPRKLKTPWRYMVRVFCIFDQNFQYRAAWRTRIHT